MKNIWNR